MSEYPQSLLSQRHHVNTILESRISAAWPDDFLRRDIRTCVMPGRKIRSLLFLHAVAEDRPDINSVHSVVAAIEYSHAASVLVDDIIDADTFRHGTIATKHSWGVPKAALYAHLLSSAALKEVTFDPKLQQFLLAVYTRMCIGEMYDIFVPPVEEWGSSGYSERVYQKTAALFEFALGAADSLTQRRQDVSLRTIGRELGCLYQLSNDFYDWAPENLQFRHAENDRWPITLSLPLATYVQDHGTDCIRHFLGERVLGFAEWMTFLDVIWTPAVFKECNERIRASLDRMTVLVESVPGGLHDLLHELAPLIASREFWYHTYDMAAI